MKREEAKKIYGEELSDITNEWWRDYKIGWWEMRIINRGKKIEKKDPIGALTYYYSKLVPFDNRKALYTAWFRLWKNTPFSTRLDIGQIAKDCSPEEIERGLKREREKIIKDTVELAMVNVKTILSTRAIVYMKTIKFLRAIQQPKTRHSVRAMMK